MASTAEHALVEDIGLLQLAAATSLELVDKFKNVRGWQENEDFEIEEEINTALAQHLRSRGCDVSDCRSLFPKEILGSNGMPLYCFDGMLLSVDAAGVTTLYIGEVKHHLTAIDVRTAAGKVQRLQQRLRKLLDGTMPAEGKLMYLAQLQLFKSLLDTTKLQPQSVQLFVGGTRFDEEVVLAAAAAHYVIVAPSGGRYSVVDASEMPVEVEEEIVLEV